MIKCLHGYNFQKASSSVGHTQQHTQAVEARGSDLCCVTGSEEVNRDRGSDWMKAEFTETNDSDNWVDKKASEMKLWVRRRFSVYDVWLPKSIANQTYSTLNLATVKSLLQESS